MMRAISARWFGIAALGLIPSIFPCAAQAAETVPNLSGQWGRDMQFFEPPASGPGPGVSALRKPDGSVVAQDRVLEAAGRDAALKTGHLGPLNGVQQLGAPQNALVRKTERFKALMRKTGLVEYLRARGWPDERHPTTGDEFVQLKRRDGQTNLGGFTC